ncbi:MAG TPA: acyltransferase [Mycobacteriales bacterium]|nr:acyltransferase [Mycobacteriales bacterium]
MTTPAPGVGRGSRSAALDGVRAVAVLGVLAYHAHYPWAVGGYLGVDVFFVLSGFLITRVLLSTHRSWWGYRQFLVRRAVRLAPALVVAVAGMTLVGLLTGVPAGTVGSCGGASAGYVMNLPRAEELGCPAMWHITWSLAAEQQFYLAWPLALGALALVLTRLRSGRPPGRGHGLALAAAGCLAGYLLELVWQVAARAAGSSTAHVAYSPQGRSLVLLLGCGLALVVAARRAGRRAQVLPQADAVALLSVGALGWCLVEGELGGGVGDLVPLVVAGLASLALIAALVHAPASSRAARALGAGPVAWLGRASYSLYLWHEVAYRLAEQVAPRGSLVAEVLRFTLALALAAASYHWVEQGAQRWWARRSVRDEEPASLVASA